MALMALTRSNAVRVSATPSAGAAGRQHLGVVHGVVHSREAMPRGSHGKQKRDEQRGRALEGWMEGRKIRHEFM